MRSHGGEDEHDRAERDDGVADGDDVRPGHPLGRGEAVDEPGEVGVGRGDAVVSHDEVEARGLHRLGGGRHAPAVREDRGEVERHSGGDDLRPEDAAVESGRNEQAAVRDEPEDLPVSSPVVHGGHGNGKAAV
ncbi:MAG TPA: hypothetical protein VK915_10390 [Gaiellaceae bacterium]|nr:hypothetical protein [Gaiellaceae bacterium]